MSILLQKAEASFGKILKKTPNYFQNGRVLSIQNRTKFNKQKETRNKKQKEKEETSK